MWFRNLHFYQFVDPVAITEETLLEKLEPQRFQPCGRQAKEAVGWVSPLHRNQETLVYTANGCLLFCMRREQKVIPPSTVNEALEERIEQVELEQGRQVFRKERQQFKEDIMALLMPQAFTRATHIHGYIDTRNGFLVVNAGSHAIADTFISLLIDSLGVLGAVKLTATENPAQVMNRWLIDGLPEFFSPSGEYELKDPVDERIARFKNNESDFQVIQDLIADGFWVSKLGLQFQEQLKCTLHDDLQLKGVKFSEQLLNQNDEMEIEDAAAKFDADFVLMSETLAELYEAIVSLFVTAEEPGVNQ